MTSTPSPDIPPGLCLLPGKPRLPTTYDDLTREAYFDEQFEFDNLQGLLLTYLNQGGDPEKLEAALNDIPLPNLDDTVHTAVQAANFNNDGVPDLLAWLLIRAGENIIDTALYGFICQEHQYQTAFAFRNRNFERFTRFDGYHILTVQDMNRNGVQEVVVYFRAGEQYTFWILEWDSHQMAGLFSPEVDPISLMEVRYRQIQSGTLSVEDTNGDGLIELLATRTYDWDDMWPHCPGATDVWAWDGVSFSLDCSLVEN